jgi:hypothetical protein
MIEPKVQAPKFCLVQEDGNICGHFLWECHTIEVEEDAIVVKKDSDAPVPGPSTLSIMSKRCNPSTLKAQGEVFVQQTE